MRLFKSVMDNNHIRGQKELDERLGLLNCYVIKNEAKKNDDNGDFKGYTSLMNWEQKNYQPNSILDHI
jgi:hypothetical protein